MIADRTATGHQIIVVAEKLRDQLHRGIEVDGKLIHLDAGIGVSIITAASRETALDALHQAEIAMRQTKLADSTSYLH